MDSTTNDARFEAAKENLSKCISRKYRAMSLARFCKDNVYLPKRIAVITVETILGTTLPTLVQRHKLGSWETAVLLRTMTQLATLEPNHQETVGEVAEVSNMSSDVWSLGPNETLIDFPVENRLPVNTAECASQKILHDAQKVQTSPEEMTNSDGTASIADTPLELQFIEANRRRAVTHSSHQPMRGNRQRVLFESTQAGVAECCQHLPCMSSSLAKLGEQLACYVPRLLRDYRLDQFLGTTFAELEQLYDVGSWAIDDVIRLLQRLLDKEGFCPVPSRPVSALSDGQERPHVVSCDEQHAAEDVREDCAEPPPIAKCKIWSTPADANFEELQARFDALRQLLVTDCSHSLLEVELREFLEPHDSDIPFQFLGHSIRDLLETPFERLSKRWIGDRTLRCLINLIERAGESIRSLTGQRDEDAIVGDDSWRPRRQVVSVPRELDCSGKAWRMWCEIIQEHHEVRRMPLGTFARCLQDLPASLWHRSVSSITDLTLNGLKTIPGLSETKSTAVVDVIRSLALDLSGIQSSTHLAARIIAGPLHGVAIWLDEVLTSRRVPSADELVIQLLRPLSYQLRHDLPVRTAEVAVRRLRLDEAIDNKTLEELGEEFGVTRERIRQLELQGPVVLQLRFPQGCYLLEQLQSQLQSVPDSKEQTLVVNRIVVQCFGSDSKLDRPQETVEAAWEAAGHKKLTPMTAAQIQQWSGQCFPSLAPVVVLEWVQSHAPSCEVGGRTVWFSNSELDRILRTLYRRQQPLRLGELLLVETLLHGDVTVVEDAVIDLDVSDERNLWARVRSDSRFVECEEHLLLPAERCGFEREAGTWFVRLEVSDLAEHQRRERITVESLAHLIVSGMLHLGIADATAWGVHRYANELLQRMFLAKLPESITPFILADMLVTVTEPLIGSMRKRRLRWDALNPAIRARGKRGWVGHIVAEFGRPLLLRELSTLLRHYYQDYADYVVKQLTSEMEDEGETDDRVQFVTEFGNGISTLLVPTAWRLNASEDNVSDGVLEVVRRLARQVRSGRAFLEELKSVSWLATLVERHVDEDDESIGDAHIDDESDKRRDPLHGNAHDASRLQKYPERRRFPGVGANTLAASPVLTVEQLAALHDSEDVTRVFAASLEQPADVLVAYAFGRILRCRPQETPWSLAELALMDADAEWLRAVFERISAQQIQHFLTAANRFPDFSQEAQFGSVLLLVESELARRYASEMNLWAAVHRQLSWAPDTNRILFNRSQPNARHRSYLEAAARELGLRNAFGEDSAQEWYQSVFLQVGFSKLGFERRLSEWLAGQNRPVSVDRLLDDERFASASFRELWEALQNYRIGRIKRHELQQRITESPWVLEDWHESLIERCRAEVAEPKRFNTGLTDGEPAVEVESEDEWLVLSVPALKYVGNELCFICSVTATKTTDLIDDAYDISLNGTRTTRLLRQPDGSYASSESQIRLPDQTNTVTATLQTRSGEIVATQELVLWDVDEDVDGYVVQSGRRVSPWLRAFADREVFLVYAADLVIEPECEPIAIVGAGSRRIVHLSASECRQTVLKLEGKLLWNLTTRVWPEWREHVSIQIEYRSPNAPTEYRFKVSHPHHVEPTAWRTRRTLKELQRVGRGTHVSEWMPLDRETKAAGRVSITVLLRSEVETTELRKTLPLQLPGHLWKRNGVWDYVPQSSIISATEVESAFFRLAPPESKTEQWHVFEGQHWVCRAETKQGERQLRGQRIDHLIGRGAPLLLRSEPYNSVEPERSLLSGVCNYGLIDDVQWQDNGVVKISLLSPIEADTGHQVFGLKIDGMVNEWGSVSEYLVEPTSNSSATWILRIPETETSSDFVALAVAYDRGWLGSWWHDDWTSALKPTAELDESEMHQRVQSLADAVRWFRLPALERAVLPKIRQFAAEQAADVIPVWLSDTSPHQFQYDDRSEWNVVLRSLLGGWMPSLEAAAAIERRLDETSLRRDAGRLETATNAFMEVDGLLAARFLRVCLQGEEFLSDRRQTRLLLAVLQQHLLNGMTLAMLKTRVAEGVARSDKPPEGTTNFIEDALLANVLRLFAEDSNVEEFNQRNIEVAMRLDAFRRLVVVTCLEQLSKEI